MTTKRCTKCGAEKSFSDFSAHPNGKFGLQATCKACYSAAASRRYWSNIEANREKSKLRSREYAAANPEKVRESKRRWASENPEAMDAARRKWIEANRERKRATSEAWRKANLSRFNEAGKAWKRANPDAMKRYRLSRYGLTEERFDAMRAEQDFRCAICHRHESETHNGLVVDHCHNSNRVRGLLCIKCNTGLGAFCDHPGHLLAAERYIQAHR